MISTSTLRVRSSCGMRSSTLLDGLLGVVGDDEDEQTLLSEFERHGRAQDSCQRA